LQARISWLGSALRRAAVPGSTSAKALTGASAPTPASTESEQWLNDPTRQGAPVVFTVEKDVGECLGAASGGGCTLTN
jgi:hypothetical protein